MENYEINLLINRLLDDLNLLSSYFVLFIVNTVLLLLLAGVIAFRVPTMKDLDEHIEKRAAQIQQVEPAAR